jgi:hypothetical protein
MGTSKATIGRIMPHYIPLILFISTVVVFDGFKQLSNRFVLICSKSELPAH